ncbi:MAG: PorP/SprF family type IX secretion system membrane protein [Cytophagaceae bacterium]
MKITLLCVFYFSVISLAQAQFTKIYPVQSAQFFRNYNLINPASHGLYNTMEINPGFLSHLGPFKEIKSYFISGSFQINPRITSNRPRQVVGIILLTDKRGELINRTRAYISYAVHIKLSEQYSLSAGTSVGLASFTFSGTSANSSGSDTKPDGNFGLWLYKEGFNFGISINQMFNTKLQPIREEFQLTRHFNINAEKKFDLSPVVQLMPIALIRYPGLNHVDIDIATLCTIQNILSFGGNFRKDRGIAFMLGLDKIPLSSSDFSMMFSYQIPSGKTRNSNIQIMELTLRLSMERKDKS